MIRSKAKLDRQKALRRAGYDKATEPFEPQRKRETFDRKAVFARDAGVCFECGLDTEALKRQYLVADYLDRHIILEDNGIPNHRINTDWWDGHHKEAVIENGNSRIENISTLCCRCHQKHTKVLMGKKAQAIRRAWKFNKKFEGRVPKAEEVL